MCSLDRYIVRCPDPLKHLKQMPTFVGLEVNGTDIGARTPIEQVSVLRSKIHNVSHILHSALVLSDLPGALTQLALHSPRSEFHNSVTVW